MSLAKTLTTVAVATLCASAASATTIVQSITMDARYAQTITNVYGDGGVYGKPTGFSSAQYVAAFNGLAPQTAGYLDQTLTAWNGSQSNSAAGGANTNLGYHDEVVFNVTAADAGVWTFRTGIDFGLGGTLIVDNTPLQTQTQDMWWNYSYGNASQYLQGSINLTPGVQHLNVYGLEDCCDGGTQGQYMTPGASSFANFSVPEPATWLMMLIGVGAIGASLRGAQRRRAVS